MRFVGFLVTILLLTALSWLLVGTFVYGLLPGGWRPFVVGWAASVVPLFVLIRNIATGRYPSAAVRLLLFRVFWYVQLLMLALALAAVAGFVVGLIFGAPAAGGRVGILMLLPVLIAVGLWGYVGSRRLVVEQVTLTPRRLPPMLDGLRIVQLSDLHVGPQTSRTHLAKISAATENAHPHIIAYTGDQVDDYPRDIEVFAAALGHLRAPLGVYAIAGNHDVYAGWGEVRRGLEAMGVNVLVNNARQLTHNGATFWIAGTGDPAGLQFVRGQESGAPDIDLTLAQVPNDAFCLVLAHNPALFPVLAERGVDVVLSGHTHHGQLSVPSKGWSLASVFLEYAMGTYHRNDALLYVSPGTNFWGIPFRIGALPEVTVVTLRAAAG